MILAVMCNANMWYYQGSIMHALIPAQLSEILILHCTQQLGICQIDNSV
jgi:hypothetical protein